MDHIPVAEIGPIQHRFILELLEVGRDVDLIYRLVKFYEFRLVGRGVAQFVPVLRSVGLRSLRKSSGHVEIMRVFSSDLAPGAY